MRAFTISIVLGSRDLAAELGFGLLKSLLYMLRDSSSTDELLENGAKHVCRGLLLKE